MIDFIDANGKTHIDCPRCGAALTDMENNIVESNIIPLAYLYCRPCNLVACRDSDDSYFIQIQIEKYTVYWFRGQCLVDVFDGSDTIKPEIQLPIFEYTVSAKQIKTYVIFS